MGKNSEFGRRVTRAREKLQMKQSRLAQLVGIPLSRLKNLESGLMDECDYTDQEVRRFANALNCSPCLLLHREQNSHVPRCQSLGMEPCESAPPADVIAQRSRRGPVQQQLGFGFTCPRCNKFLSAFLPSCLHCGYPLCD